MARGLTTLFLSAALSGVLAAPALAAPRLDGIIGDHAVLQRGRPIPISGTASPNEPVLIALGGKTVTTRTDRDGRFKAELPALPAGGPYDLSIAAPSGALVARDLMVGDVYLCSGQSNMEMPVGVAQSWIPDANPPLDPKLRLVTITKRSSAAPLDTFRDTPRWAAADQGNIPGFSAACFYMAQALRRAAPDVPVGAVHASWGGSRISAWLTPAGQRAAGLGEEADLLALYARDPAAAERRASGRWEAWWRAGSGDATGREPWQPDAALDWKPVLRFSHFEEWGVPELADYNGMIWYQREITVTPAQARGPAMLSIGMVDDADRTWVNGVGVGGSSLAGQARTYALAEGVLKPGRNVITVNDDDVYAFGGMTGPAETMRITFADGSSIPLGDSWRYAIAKRLTGGAPRVPWDDINGVGTLYNGMIVALGGMPLAGVAWYQGESDTGLPGYDTRLSELMKGWRARFASPQMPFAIVQLANYGALAKAPGESGWGWLRDVQRRVAEADGRSGLAVALDLGDPRDIHPGEKHEVGVRLARVMRARVLGEAISPSGPALAGARREQDGSVSVSFTGVTGALHATGSDRAIGFELCGAAAGSCRYADARVEGQTVRLAGANGATRVRYAWADAPSVNVFDDAGLTLPGFEAAVK
ncbi:sialic acid-specific 9-O-acetylesterase [Sphingomonas metalli]|uniref:Sialic acid-specific 9-O-acetylesterase n=1 Tax=Sphingomonas metalli TaxID=1779358 RepID=A0A916T3C1_9SPHN|nr:sialate O-acetylesterase [Sphingomonas metalli]GGB27289.1 sialic acid-specific 9-O-acetylesterase [Sphingomonas metalli]